MKKYDSMKTLADRERPLWRSVSKYVMIGVDTDYNRSGFVDNAGQQMDEFIDDPTAAISVNQAGDYLVGIMYGTGEKLYDIEPSEDVLAETSKEAVAPWYAFATAQSLTQLNHHETGFASCLKPYAYDQVGFGNSGIGLFPNDDYKRGTAHNCYTARLFGVDNTVIDEGKSGLVEYIGANYHWSCNRIIGEFAMTDGLIDKTKLAKLPKPIQDAWNKGNVNDTFNIVCLIYPRTDFNPKLKGKRGAKYIGEWFLDQASYNKPFYTEDFKERPVNWCRAIKVRGKKYGNSSFTMLMSTVRCVNFMVGTTVEILEKMGDPALGMFSNAIMGDGVLDSSPHGLTIFNQALLGGKDKPAFPLYDVGNPEGIIKFLIPYLNEKIVTAAKVDILLDFSSAKEMSATESLQKYSIRGKSLSGMLMQQKNEQLIPTCSRGISICLDFGILGVNPRLHPDSAQKLRERGESKRIIPEAVLKVMESGRPWYTLKFNNELEKLIRTEAIQNLLQLLNAIAAIMALYPAIAAAVNWYKLLKAINDNLDSNSQILLTEKEFKAEMEKLAEQQRVALALQAGQAGAQIKKDSTQADKNKQEAQNAGK